METRDYYLVLGVDRNVGADGIKSAYRKLARQYHPDVSKDPDAEDKFKEIRKAYETLKSPEKRSAYDQRLSPPPKNRASNRLPVDYGAFWGALQWMGCWHGWWAWQGVWARRAASSTAD